MLRSRKSRFAHLHEKRRRWFVCHLLADERKDGFQYEVDASNRDAQFKKFPKHEDKIDVVSSQRCLEADLRCLVELKFVQLIFDNFLRERLREREREREKERERKREREREREIEK